MKSDSTTTIVFVEGKGDENFLKHLARHAEIGHLKFLQLSGKPNWQDKLRTQRIPLEDNTLRGGRNLIIIDADQDNPGQIRQEIQSRAAAIGLSVEVYVFPDNESPGDLETLILETVSEEKKAILSCYQSYLECVSKHDSNFEIPDRKSLVSEYLSWFYANKSASSAGKRDYSNPQLWDLNHPGLRPLIAFLKGENQASFP